MLQGVAPMAGSVDLGAADYPVQMTPVAYQYQYLGYRPRSTYPLLEQQ